MQPFAIRAARAGRGSLERRVFGIETYRNDTPELTL